MKKEEMQSATNEELISKYIRLAIVHGELRGAKEANLAFDEAVTIWRELQQRGSTAIEMFSHLLESDSPIIRLSAAAKLLFVMPQKAEQVLEQLTGEPRLLGHSASMTLKEWRAGRLKPLTDPSASRYGI
jgi:hypothetical protein